MIFIFAFLYGLVEVEATIRDGLHKNNDSDGNNDNDRYWMMILYLMVVICDDSMFEQ